MNTGSNMWNEEEGNSRMGWIDREEWRRKIKLIV
jgi:hypothetical protein